jgi:hypothetical protein
LPPRTVRRKGEEVVVGRDEKMEEEKEKEKEARERETREILMRGWIYDRSEVPPEEVDKKERNREGKSRNKMKKW